MQVIVNGENKNLADACTLAEALLILGYHEDMPMAVAVDYQVIPKQDHAKLMLTAGSTIEILLPMQGG